MGVGSVSSMNSMSNLQTTMAGSTDIKSKNIQNEITDVQQQMQKLSSQEELSADEKADERKKLQREISSLNTELERRQEEFLRSQKREVRMAELQEEPAEEEKAIDRVQTDEEAKPVQRTEQKETVIFKNSDGVVILKGAADSEEQRDVDADESDEEDVIEKGIFKEETDDETEDTGIRPTHEEMHAMISADVSAQQASRQGAVVARISGEIATLKGEMSLDEQRGEDTDKKQEQLERLEEREEKARIFQFSALGDTDNAMKLEGKLQVSGVQTDMDDSAFINASKLAQEDEQRFYVSFG